MGTFLRNEKRSKSSKRPSADGHVKTSSAPSTDGKKSSSGSSSRRKEDSLPYDDGDRREMERNSQQGSTAQLSRSLYPSKILLMLFWNASASDLLLSSTALRLPFALQ